MYISFWIRLFHPHHAISIHMSQNFEYTNTRYLLSDIKHNNKSRNTSSSTTPEERHGNKHRNDGTKIYIKNI
jgi:hypothetical protein